jgi:hypothetical protein
MGVSVLQSIQHYIVAGDILGGFRLWADGINHCFPLLGNQCGDRYRTTDGQTTAVALDAPRNRFYVARSHKVYAWRWSDVKLSLKYALARSNPTPLAVFILEEDQAAMVRSLACSNQGRLFSGQDDGSIAVWPMLQVDEPPPASDDTGNAQSNDDDGEYEYEVETPELMPEERFEAFAGGVVHVHNVDGAIWSSSSNENVIRVWSAC